MFQSARLDIVDCKDLDMKQKKDYHFEPDLISVESLMVAELLPAAAELLPVAVLVVDKSDDVRDWISFRPRQLF